MGLSQFFKDITTVVVNKTVEFGESIKHQWQSLPDPAKKASVLGTSGFIIIVGAKVITGILGMGSATKKNAQTLEVFKKLGLIVEIHNAIVVAEKLTWDRSKKLYTIATEPLQYYSSENNRNPLTIRVSQDQIIEDKEMAKKNVQIDHIQIRKELLDAVLPNPLNQKISIKGKISSYNDGKQVLDKFKKWTLYEISIIPPVQ
jgi:hypothetical protein